MFHRVDQHRQVTQATMFTFIDQKQFYHQAIYTSFFVLFNIIEMNFLFKMV